jgi:hypothetical protein
MRRLRVLRQGIDFIKLRFGRKVFGTDFYHNGTDKISSEIYSLNLFHINGHNSLVYVMAHKSYKIFLKIAIGLFKFSR